MRKVIIPESTQTLRRRHAAEPVIHQNLSKYPGVTETAISKMGQLTVSGVPLSDGRENAYQWTDTYLQSDLRAIVDEKSPDTSLSEFYSQNGTGIAVRAGSLMEDVLLNHTSTRVYSCGTFAMAETAFVKGYISALGGHEVVLQQVIQDYPNMYHFLDGSVMTAHLGVAFSKDDSSGHCEKINAALNEMKADGTITAIFDSYYCDSPAEKEVNTNERPE